MGPLEILIGLALISVSAFFSSSEIALFSLSRFQIRNLKDTFRSGHRKVKRLLSDPSGLLITILVLNETVNISLSTLVTSYVNHHPSLGPIHGLPPWAANAIEGTLITSPLVLLFGEITPKTIAAAANQLITRLTVEPLALVYDAMAPIRWLLKRLLKTISRIPSGESAPSNSEILKEADFLMLVEEGRKEGTIQQSEFELIKKVFELDDTQVASIYTPLAQVQSLSAHTTLKTALSALRGQKYSRIPITTSDKKQVVGILYSKDLLRAKLETELLAKPISSLMRKPLFVNSKTRLNALFRKFKQYKNHMAVVQGQDGEALGIVTMSDVLETLL